MDFQLPRHIFDRIDKLTSTTMPSYYVFMTVFICGYFGHQIHCFEKSDWVSSWIEYATDYCFVHGTYFVKTNETYSAEVIRQMIPYQYLPFVFAAMGIFLTIPAQMFYFADFCSGTKFDQLLMSGENLNFEKFLNRVSKRTRENAFSGSLMLFFYTFYKVSNILIICIQLCIAPVIMTQQNGYFEAFNTVKTIIYGPDWKESGIFPRVTTCEFLLREMGYANYVTTIETKKVQCVLRTNGVIETFFAFYIISLFVVLLLNGIDLLYFIIYFIRKNQIFKNMLKDEFGTVEFEDGELEIFFEKECFKIGNDGHLFLYHFATRNSLLKTCKVATEITLALMKKNQ